MKNVKDLLELSKMSQLELEELLTSKINAEKVRRALSKSAF